MTSFEEWVSMSLMAVAIILTVVNVIARYVLKAAIPWSQEVIGIAWTWTCMLGVSWCFRRYKHAGVDFLIMKFKPSSRRWIQLITIVILLVAMVFLLYMSIIITRNGGSKLTNYFQLPYTVKYIAATISFFNMTVYCVLFLIKAITEPDKFCLSVSTGGGGLDRLMGNESTEEPDGGKECCR